MAKTTDTLSAPDDTASLAPADFDAIARRAIGSRIVSTDRAEQVRAQEQHAANVRRETDLKALETALGSRYSRSAVDSYAVYSAAQKSILARVDALAGRMSEIVANGTDILFMGTVGTGKDHLLARLLYRAVDVGASVRFVAGQELYGRLRGTMDSASMESERKVLDDFCKPDVLAISDPVPPAGDLSAWRREVLFRLIDRRYRARKGVWLTCNARSAAEADKMLSEPVWDRLQHGAEMLLCEWPSFRERTG